MSKTIRVLIVDDDRALREALLCVLQDAGYEAVVADSLLAARSLLLGGRFDGVLLHLHLDGQNAASLESVRVMTAVELLDVSDVDPSQGEPTRAAQSDTAFDGDLDLRRNVDRLERRLILRALVLARGNRTQAARMLGIRRALLYARLDKMGTTKDNDENRPPTDGERRH